MKPHTPKTYDTIIGIDPGVITGVALWYGSKRSGVMLQTNIFEAYDRIVHNSKNGEALVILEDARLNKRKADETSGPQSQGAGWVKILSGEFERMLHAHGIDYILKKPQPTKKLSPEAFKAITGIQTLKKESHLRDAVMLVWEHPMTVHYIPPPEPPKR